MNYDEEFETEQEYIEYICKAAITKVELQNEKTLIIPVRSEEEMEELSMRLWSVYDDRDDIHIYFELKTIH
tara:strand:+ start:2959 stop:3171 length:213 start_codon:yes stop_codon:yes gene_type:complete